MTQALDPTLLVARQLDGIRSRLAELAHALSREDEAAAASELSPVGERDLLGVFPMSWLRTRLALTATEEGILWLLLAHELCPRSRRAIREGDVPWAVESLAAVRLINSWALAVVQRSQLVLGKLGCLIRPGATR